MYKYPYTTGKSKWWCYLKVMILSPVRPDWVRVTPLLISLNVSSSELEEQEILMTAPYFNSELTDIEGAAGPVGMRPSGKLGGPIHYD